MRRTDLGRGGVFLPRFFLDISTPLTASFCCRLTSFSCICVRDSGAADNVLVFGSFTRVYEFLRLAILFFKVLIVDDILYIRLGLRIPFNSISFSSI